MDKQLEAARAAREARQAEVNDLIGPALGRTTAALQWAMHSRDPDEEPGITIGTQHPALVAEMAVRQAFDHYEFPSAPRLRACDVIRNAGQGGHQIHAGEILVQATLRTLSGINHEFYVPVQIRAGRALDPVVIRDHGVIKPMTQSTFDEITEAGTFYGAVPNRLNMYSPPPTELRAPSITPLLRPGMFGFGEVNRCMTAAYVKAAIRGYRPKGLPEFSEAQAQARTALSATAPDCRQWAERPLPEICPGDAVALTKDAYMTERGGQRWHIAAGTEGQVQRDVCENGDCFCVWFPELGFSARVPGDALRLR